MLASASSLASPSTINMPSRAHTAPRLALVRHGATGWTLTGRYQGRADPALCAQGFAEAAALAASLGQHAIGQIVTSPLLRARQTAALLAAAASLPSPRIDDQLSEIDYGAWEGLTQPEIKATWPGLLRAWKHTPEAVRPPGGESLGELRQRVRAALSTWRPASGTHAVLLVTHATWIKLALIETGQLPPANFRHFPVPTGALFWLPGPLSQAPPAPPPP